MLIKIYRVITETGYTEFRDQQAAIDFAQGRIIEEMDREVPDQTPEPTPTPEP